MFEASIDNESLELLPTLSFGGKIVMVNSIDELDEAISYLATQQVLGFDTETRPSFTKGKKHHVALLQLSGADKAYLFRLHSLGLPAPLAKLMESDKVLKVGAAVKDDITALNRLTHFTARGFVDLQKTVEHYHIREKSVKKMAALVLNVRISKSQQLSNWENEEYTDAQKAYAATDAWICREIYMKLTNHSNETQAAWISQEQR